MPDTLRKDLLDTYWAIIDSLDAEVVKPGNKIKQNVRGYLKKMVGKLPADSGEVEVGFEEWTRTDYELADGLDAESETYGASGGPFEIERTARVLITVRHELPKGDQPNVLADTISHAIFKAGTRLGNPSVVDGTSQHSMTERDTRPDEKFHPGRVEEIRQTVTVIQDGRTLLAL